jgi:ABC-2 type transport system ATP-binding protein
MIKVEGLTKRYDRFVAVRGIGFEVEKGQIAGFLGPNGAGKTTTMRILTCFMPPTEGQAAVAGFDVMRSPMEVKRRIGYLPEVPPLYPEMEVEEYLAFVGRLKGIPSSALRKRLDDAMAKCAIGDVRKKLISKLSRGYRQRVGLAQAVIHNPEVLVLDEPTAGLDPKQIHETRQLIRGLAGEHTIIISTHILSEVEQTCDHVIIINKGLLVARDTMENLTSRLRGQEAVALEVEGRGQALDQAAARQRLEQVAGVSRVIPKDSRNGRHFFEVEGLPGKHIRGDLARAAVEAGWNLNELRAASASLEDVFLELTAGEQAEKTGGAQ